MEPKDSFLTTVKRSAFDFSYYQQLVTKTFFAGAKYLYLLLLIGFFIGSVKSAITLVPKIPQISPFVENIKNAIKTSYPAELVVTVKNGELKTNVQEPYYADFFFKKTDLPPGNHFITIDTKADMGDFINYKTAVLVTKTGIIYKDGNNGGYKVYLFEKNFNFVLDKTAYDLLAGRVSPFLNYMPAIIIGFVSLFFILGPFTAAGFSLIGKLIFVLIIALIFLIIAKILKKDLTYKKICVLSLFGSTLPVILQTIQSLFPPWSNGLYNNLPNMVFFALMIIVIVKYQNQTSQPQPVLTVPVSPPVTPQAPQSPVSTIA